MKYSKDQPIYVQLMEDIKVKILNGTYSFGDKLPSIREYAEEMLVNPNTVQRAFRELENLNYIESRTGLGYYTNDSKEEIKKFKREYLNIEIDNFIEKMTQLNFDKKEIIEIIKEKL